MVPTPGLGAAGAFPAGAEGDSSSAAPGGSPLGPGDAENPYESPRQYGQQHHLGPDPLAANRVAGPATALIVTAVLAIVMQALGILLGILVNPAQLSLLPFPGRNRPDFVPVMLPVGVAVTANVVQLVLTVVMLLGAIKMKNLENYSFAMASAIIAVIPCLSPCCLLGLPFGIWALVVLSDGSVKAAFRS